MRSESNDPKADSTADPTADLTIELSKSKRLILVTGATGFLGGAVARRLCAEGYRVRVSGRDLKRGEELIALGAEFVSADLRDAEAVDALCSDVDVIIHAGALSSLWGTREAFWEVNVEGTRHVIEAALKRGVSRVVYVSSPSVYFNFRDAEHIREDAPLPPRFVNHYTASKRAAEEMVIDAATTRGLNALILRPRALFGPGDTAIFPRIIRALESGRLKVIGSGENLADLTYIDNAVDACILAMSAPLHPTDPARIYNITDGAPTPLWPIIDHIADAFKYPPPRRRVPLTVARFAARTLERYHRLFKPHQEPIFTEYSVGILGCGLTLDITRAREELGYQPRPSEEALRAYIAELVAERDTYHSIKKI